MPLYCTMVNACGQIGGYPIPSYRIPVAYVEHAEVPSALSARPKGVYSNAPHPMSAIGVCRLNRSTQHFILDGKMECIQ